jgi:DNA topoisomerase-2
MEMYTKAISREQGKTEDDKEKDVIITDKHDRWDIGFAVSDGSFNQVSFVNSIATTSGGTHVNYIADQIVEKLMAVVNKKNKAAVKLKPAQIKNHIFLFVNCSIVNPAFTSQTKEQLTTKASQFGSKPVLSDRFLKAIEKTEVIQNIMHFAQQKADQMMKKTDGNKRNRINNAKLTDANKAGTKDGHLCTLILTEGESASVLALAGRAVVNQDLFGVFPLRGKLLNVRDATVDQIMKNQEIQNIKKFMGLQHKKEYTIADMKGLRYGHLMIMTDQDHDGSHIKGLLINFLQCQFPSLLKIPGFLLEFITPIVKVWKGDPKHPRQLKSFFSMPEYEEWKEQHQNEKGWDHKYYKGLGTSDIPDAQVYFKDLDTHMKRFQVMREEEEKLIELAFSKKKADARKEWLGNFVPGNHLDLTTSEISYDDFVNKEFILFSIADNLRSIPSVMDGLKPGQRKVLYTCFRRNIRKDVKVVELAGSVSGSTDYAHGEASMQGTIVGLAQNFVGSNNINYLEPSGNFGSRLRGGADAASARYIYTRLSPFARRLFHAHDDALLKYGESDGHKIEPEMFVPVLPTILVNGSSGIGTGWSSEIPNFNPMDIIDNLRIRLQEGSSKEDMKPMIPWYKGFNGTTQDLGNDRYQFTGTIRQTGENELEVTELPVRYWTQEFKEKLEDIIKAEKTPAFIKDYIDYNTPDRVHFIIKMEDKHMLNAVQKGLEETFKLYSRQATSNLVAFDAQGRIHKYATVLDIMEEFYHVRLRYYEKRKQHQLEVMEKELSRMNNQARFIQMIIDGKLVVSKKKKAVLVAELKKLNFTPFPKVEDARKAGEEEDAMQDDEETDDAEVEVKANDYDYLLGVSYSPTSRHVHTDFTRWPFGHLHKNALRNSANKSVTRRKRLTHSSRCRPKTSGMWIWMPLSMSGTRSSTKRLSARRRLPALPVVLPTSLVSVRPRVARRKRERLATTATQMTTPDRTSARLRRRQSQRKRVCSATFVRTLSLRRSPMQRQPSRAVQPLVLLQRSKERCYPISSRRRARLRPMGHLMTSLWQILHLSLSVDDPLLRNSSRNRLPLSTQRMMSPMSSPLWLRRPRRSP